MNLHFHILNCNVYGDVKYGGGICGSYTANYNGNLTISMCSLNGNIVGKEVGGLIGNFSCQYGGKIYIKKRRNSYKLIPIVPAGGRGVICIVDIY